MLIGITVVLAAVVAVIVWKSNQPLAEASIPRPDYTLLVPQAEGLGAAVEIAGADKVAAMKAAIRAVCPSNGYCLIKFILPEELAKYKSGVDIRLITTGAKSLATWSTGSGFGNWDCDVLGATDAPKSANCDPGMKEAYAALSDAEKYEIWAKHCGWPLRYGNTIQAILDYANKQGNGDEFARKLRNMNNIPVQHDYGCLIRDNIQRDADKSIAEWTAATARIATSR
jgi:hypothetical protein